MELLLMSWMLGSKEEPNMMEEIFRSCTSFNQILAPFMKLIKFHCLLDLKFFLHIEIHPVCWSGCSINFVPMLFPSISDQSLTFLITSPIWFHPCSSCAKFLHDTNHSWNYIMLFKENNFILYTQTHSNKFYLSKNLSQNFYKIKLQKIMCNVFLCF